MKIEAESVISYISTEIDKARKKKKFAGVPKFYEGKIKAWEEVLVTIRKIQKQNN